VYRLFHLDSLRGVPLSLFGFVVSIKLFYTSLLEMTDLSALKLEVILKSLLLWRVLQSPSHSRLPRRNAPKWARSAIADLTDLIAAEDGVGSPCMGKG